MTAPFELSLTRAFDAPVDLVFGIWADPEHMVKWWGPTNFVTKHFESDFRVGGAYRACISNPRYGESWMSGQFVEIVPNQRIVFTFRWDDSNDSIGVETLITVTFEARDGKTLQTFHQAPFLNADSRDRHVEGWNSVLDNEEIYVARVAKEGAKS